VRLINKEGEQLGIKTLNEALELAANNNLDLVEIVPNADPPVCKILDYGKYVFDQKKKQMGAKKKQKKTTVKELKFRPVTDIGDYNIKIRNAKRFIENGDKLKITIRFRGREMEHRVLGMDMLKRIEEDLKEITQIEAMPKLEGRQMIMVLAPIKKKK
jgi:translation initiation factor IF-3